MAAYETVFDFPLVRYRKLKAILIALLCEEISGGKHTHVFRNRRQRKRFISSPILVRGTRFDNFLNYLLSLLIEFISHIP